MFVVNAGNYLYTGSGGSFMTVVIYIYYSLFPDKILPLHTDIMCMFSKRYINKEELTRVEPIILFNYICTL